VARKAARPTLGAEGDCNTFNLAVVLVLGESGVVVPVDPRAHGGARLEIFLG
jgi:hypothetical protein